MVALPPLSDRERAALAVPDIRIRAGVHRSLPADTLTAGQWEFTPDGGRVWRVAVTSPGSAALRLEFRDFDAGQGRVWLHSGDQVAGPYSGRGAFGDGHFWTSILPGDSAVLEYEPEAGRAHSEDVPFEVRTLSHQTVAAGEWTGGGPAGPVPDAGAKDPADTCHLDPNCFPEWRDTMRMVGQLAYEDAGSSFVCSGALINTRDNSRKLYLLTAGHCINNEAAARSLQVYWSYQTSGCGAPPQSRQDSLKSTQGASLMAAAAFSEGDFSLVLLKDVPPGVLFANWDLADPPVGSPVFAVHHPAGSYKRISFGNRGGDATVSVEGSTAPGGKFMEVYWDKGRVEHGSSGSPLFSAPGTIVGELSYGLFSEQVSACQIDPSYSGYGRFSNIYAGVKDFLENLPAASVTADTDASFTVTNGTPAPARQMVRLTTKAAVAVPFKLRADAGWIRLSATSGTVSAAAPAVVEISADPARFDRADRFQSTVAVFSGAAEPQFINVRADVKVDRSNVAAIVTPNPALGLPATPRYSFTVRLEEKAGLATRLTAVKLNNYDFSANIADWFGATLIPAGGALEASLSTDFPFAPGAQYFEFWGLDEATGRRWYTTATTTF